ncbi:MAG: L-rhamnose mutarotase [Tannerellaceae bacterium]|nr:L-rhamnose mutarotase [Tannerellaceae bacterium]
METQKTGYKTKNYRIPVKRYCQTLDLKNSPELIEEYRKRHGKASYWPIIGEGIRSVGILEMEIYLCDNRLFMIVETPMDFDWEEAFQKLAGLPQQKEWETYMSVFQQAETHLSSAEKWKLMERIFHLYEY